MRFGSEQTLGNQETLRNQRRGGSGLLEQLAAILKQRFYVVEGIKLSLIRLLRPLDRRFENTKPLFQLHQPMGKGDHRLGQIFGSSSDPEGHRFGCHRRQRR